MTLGAKDEGEKNEGKKEGRMEGKEGWLYLLLMNVYCVAQDCQNIKRPSTRKVDESIDTTGGRKDGRAARGTTTTMMTMMTMTLMVTKILTMMVMTLTMQMTTVNESHSRKNQKKNIRVKFCYNQFATTK